ncbi:Glycosyl transferase family 2 [Brevinema andersonii]|uniref:Glycosyl transferase family 2 n=1 Tax=Brevinema andersonii TaxID=34097 RepID=A0A1I1DVC6_BREAD|nr:glycosyltransferase [Brevinema andersonii]SFB78999.1 Glycosyl transferase family 2 [Brevinema andersonii]
MKPLISIVCPVYHKEEIVRTHYEELSKIALEIADRYDVEFVYTDNCSVDKTLSILSEIAQCDSRVRIFKFSRNFGHQNSIFTAYCKVQGNMAINFDAEFKIYQAC